MNTRLKACSRFQQGIRLCPSLTWDQMIPSLTSSLILFQLLRPAKIDLLKPRNWLSITFSRWGRGNLISSWRSDQRARKGKTVSTAPELYLKRWTDPPDWGNVGNLSKLTPLPATTTLCVLRLNRVAFWVRISKRVTLALSWLKIIISPLRGGDHLVPRCPGLIHREGNLKGLMKNLLLSRMSHLLVSIKD